MAISNIPPRGQVLTAYRIRETNPGLSYGSIAKALGLRGDTVRAWLRFPERYDPYYDRVAIVRALDGDGEVYLHLTYYERRLVVALLSRQDSDEAPSTARFPEPYRERIRMAIKRHREARGERRTKTHKIAPRKRSPEFDAKVWKMRRQGIEPILIAEQLGASKSTIYGVLRSAA